MTTAEFLTELREANVRIWLDDDQLRCKAPKGVLTAQLSGRIAERKAELMAFLKSLESSDEVPHPTPTDRSGFLPLSFSQERLWFLNKLEPESTAYNLTAARRFQSRIDPHVLQKTLNELARRHEVLRTIFPQEAGQPGQRVSPVSRVPLLIQDFREHTPEEGESALHTIAQEESHLSFDLELGPVFRARLVQLSGDASVLYLSLPHIVADGWSIGVLFSQLAATYAELVSGKGQGRRELPIQYGDYAVWQREWLQGAELERLLGYWRAQVADAPLVLPYLAQRPRAKTDGEPGQYRGAVRTFTLGAGLSEAIKSLSNSFQITEFVTLFSIYGTLLARFSQVDDVLIGTPVANRNRLEFEGMVGLFVNTLVLRNHCPADHTVGELLARNHRMLLDGFEHQDLPFEQLVEAVNPDRSSGFSPVFQASFVYQNTPGNAEYHMISGGSMFDLTCYLRNTPDGIQGAFEYNTQLLDESAIGELIESFISLATAFVRNQQQRLGDLPLLSDAQRTRLADFNPPRSDIPATSNIATLFSAQASATPEACALQFAAERLSYAQLDSQSNRLAAALTNAGVEPGDRVAVCLERSIELVVSILAIVKAGAAYVPLDADYPAARISLMLEETTPRLILTGGALAGRLPGTQMPKLRVDELDLSAYADQQPVADIGARDLAYLMFTSGSTGRPKAVAVMHQNIQRLVHGANFADLGHAQTFLMLAPVSFDASTLEIWGPLLNGGRLVIAPPGVLSIEELRAQVKQHGVTTLWLTAGLFHQAVDAGLEGFESLQQLLAGGDVLSPDHVRRALEALPGCAVINGYGPTENTTFTTCHRMEAPADVTSPVPIGQPISGTQVYVLDAAGRLSPPGVAGELYAGGAGVADGYWQRPELSEERFIRDPHNPGAEATLYRTGDIVRWRPDGTLGFVGRADNQVKLRGFRIEPGEVEAVLTQHASVRQAAVVLREDDPGEKRLVAYVVGSEPDGEDESPGLRDELIEVLPDYMVPADFVWLDALPLTPNGKLDRNRLPAPKGRGVSAGRLPTTPLEVQIAAIWQQVLNLERISVADNFFELGGTSLVAVRLFNQLNKVVGRDLPLAMLFESPTVESLAASIEAAGWESAWRSLVTIQPLGARPPLFLVPGVGGNVLCFAQLAKSLGGDQPMYGLQSRGLDGTAEPLREIEAMARLYIEEVRAVQPRGPYYLGGACAGGAVAFEMAQQLIQDGEEVAALLLIETWSPRTLQLRRRKFATRLHPLLFFVKGVQRHLGELFKLKPTQWYRYVRSRLGIVKEMIEQKDVYRGDRSILYQDAVSSATYEAMSRYAPTAYPGKLYLFIAAQREVDPEKDSRFDWATLASDGYSVEHINAPDSGSILLAPHVDVLAGHVDQVLATESGRRAGRELT